MKMKRREFLKKIGAGACLAAAGRVSRASRPRIAGQRPATRDSKPNIVLCMADDQGWGDMAYYDHPALKTPNFDAMAAEALRFDRFYAAAPVCSPTRGSVM
ncbi:MAG TPA: twin-arginine translocation signal domain-containing protein, partial [Phycisphaerales bacterium]|nr:twin-arginine translocation signal domain-containing protein [Phycisphaerales bacterium]